MKNYSWYKEEAKSIMEGKYAGVIITFIILGLFSGIPSAISRSFGPKYEIDFQTMTRTLVDAGNPGLEWLFNVVAFILGAIASYAIIRMFIHLSEKEVAQTEEILLVGFQEQPLRSVVHQFIASFFVALWTLLFIIPGIMAIYKYTMGFYILNKEKGISAYDAVDKSKSYMMGHRMDLFVLDLSYLLWYILGIFTFGILWLFIIPKHQLARVLFFKDLYEKHNPKPIIEPAIEL